MAWDESEHPRESDGKFTDGAGQSKQEKLDKAKRIYDSDPEQIKPERSTFGSPASKDFKKKFEEAKSKIGEDARWRVSSEYSEEDYESMERFATPSGSTVALKPHGKGKDIVSVCKMEGDSARGSDLLIKAIQAGGDGLDAFGKRLYEFYTKNGFEAVSWTPFNAEYAPQEWKDAKEHGVPVEEEPVIFYKHTGKKPSKTYEEFINGTDPSTGEDGYDEAMKKRDKEIDE